MSIPSPGGVGIPGLSGMGKIGPGHSGDLGNVQTIQGSSSLHEISHGTYVLLTSTSEMWSQPAFQDTFSSRGEGKLALNTLCSTCDIVACEMPAAMREKEFLRIRPPSMHKSGT